MAEGVGPGRHLDKVTFAVDPQFEEFADGGCAIARLAVGDEIVFAYELGCCIVHRFDIKRVANPKNVTTPQRIETGRIIAHSVRVRARKRGKPGIKTFWGH